MINDKRRPQVQYRLVVFTPEKSMPLGRFQSRKEMSHAWPKNANGSDFALMHRDIDPDRSEVVCYESIDNGPEREVEDQRILQEDLYLLD